MTDLNAKLVEIVNHAYANSPATRARFDAAGLTPSDIQGLAEAQEELGPLVIEAKLPRKGQPKSTSYEGEGYAILRDEDTERVRDGLKRLVTLMRVEMA